MWRNLSRHQGGAEVGGFEIKRAPFAKVAAIAVDFMVMKSRATGRD
jgi:hypothetical protein